MADFVETLVQHLKQDFSGQPFAETLALALDHLGYQIRMTTAGDDPVLIVEGNKRRIIRCKYYPESIAGDYMLAYGRAMFGGRVGKGYAITVDQATPEERAYTIHVVIGRFDK